MIDHLSDTQKVYIREYLQCLNQVRAYKKTFPNISGPGARARASEFHRQPEIRQAISNLIAEQYPTEQEVLQKIILLIELDLAEYIVDGSLDLVKFQQDGYGWLIKGTKSTKYGNDVVLMDKDKALDNLVKIYKLVDTTNHFTFEVELSAQELLTEKLKTLNV